MAIDIRATVTCSLGTLISGSISDDYLQGNGLVKFRGSCEISGLITPDIGTVVTFSYTKGGTTYDIPRKLRVLSSFADPFRRTTRVELGCRLTYFSDLQEPVKWEAFDDPENASYTEADQEIITIPIHASSVMDKCLTELGITASSSPLTNKFSIAEFDFGPGYVQVLNDLLVSECYFGYLDSSEVLQIVSFDQDGNEGPVYTGEDIVDLGPIGVGQLPGEAVTVSYSTLKLRQPEAADDWTITRTSNLSTIAVNYTAFNGDPETKLYNVLTTTYEETAFDQLSTAEGDLITVTTFRKTIEETDSVAVLGAAVTEYLTAGLSFPVYRVQKITQEYFLYDDYGNETQYIANVYGSPAHLIGSLSVPFVINNIGLTVYFDPNQSRPLEYQVRKTLTVGEFQKTTSELYKPWFETIQGQQTIAAARDNFNSVYEVQTYIDQLLPTNSGLANYGLYLVDLQIDSMLRRSGTIGPSKAERTNAENAIGGNPANGYRTDSVAELELALGSATAQRRIELSMPYAPDDTFIKNAGPPITYSAIASDAEIKAKNYGRVQNRLLLGNRNGVNLQVAPERLPNAPFSPLYLKADGLTALYRSNGNQWAFDSNGIVCSTDALFWAAVSGTGTFWFPVAPGITTLPPEPPIVDGEMNANTLVLPYNETVLCDASVKLGNVLTKFNYALELLTELPALRLRTQAEVRRIRKVEVPVADIGIAAATPVVSGGGSVKPPAGSFALGAADPAVASGASVAVPLSTIAVAGLDPQQAGSVQTLVFAPAADLAIAALAPGVASGGSATVPAAGITVAAFAPSKTGYIDPDFSSVSLLLHMDGSNGSTTFTDSSSNALSVTANGNAQISTAQSKFGGESGLFDGTGDYLSANDADLALAQSDHTIEGWVRLTSLPATKWGFAYNGDPSSNNNRIQVEFNPTGTITLFLQAGTGTGVSFTTTTTLSTGTWYHLAYVKSGTSVKLFIDGVESASGTYSTTITTNNNFYVGWTRSGGVNYSINGHIDEFRITKGVARYTATFTAPTQPFADQ
jgi:hypothetical protein